MRASTEAISRLAADEGRERDRQVGAPGAERAKRREGSREILDRDLEDLLRSIEVAEEVRPEVDELHAVRQPITDQRAGHRRGEDLVAVPDREDPGIAVEGRPEVVGIAGLGRARVEGHSGAQRAGLGPGRVAQPSLGLDRRRHCRERVDEDRQDAVAESLDDRPALRLDRGAEDPIVLGEGGAHPLAVLFPEAGAALDVRDQEGCRRRGRLGRSPWRRRDVGLGHGGYAAPARQRSTKRPIRTSASSSCS